MLVILHLNCVFPVRTLLLPHSGARKICPLNASLDSYITKVLVHCDWYLLVSLLASLATLRDIT